MAAPPPNSDGPTTKQEFTSRLDSLLRSAHRNGVEIEGGWAVRTDETNQPDWGVEIYEVTKHLRSSPSG